MIALQSISIFLCVIGVMVAIVLFILIAGFIAAALQELLKRNK